MEQRKPPAKRLFQGLAGSPIAQTKPLTNAERQKRFRTKRREEKLRAQLRRFMTKLYGKCREDLRERAIEELLAANPSANAMKEIVEIFNATRSTKFWYLTDFDGTPNHKHPIVSGGYDLSGRVRIHRVVPEGQGPRTDKGALTRPLLHKGAMSAFGSDSAQWGKPKRFSVKLNNHELQDVLRDLVDEHFEVILGTETVVDADGNLVREGTPETYRCSICGNTFEWQRDLPMHIQDTHFVLVKKASKERGRKGREMQKKGKTVLAIEEEREAMRTRQQAKKEEREA